MSVAPIHLCVYSSQPDIQIYCNNDWTIPKWGTCISGFVDTGIYEGEAYKGAQHYRYTFEDRFVTRKDCLNKRKEKSNADRKRS